MLDNYAPSRDARTHSGFKFLFVFSVVLTMLLLLGSTSAHAAQVTEGDFTIERGQDRVVTLTSYKGSSADVTLPTSATINDVLYPITSIKSSAFSGNDAITSITIPEGYTDVTTEAFKNCTSLTTVHIPGSLTMLAANAFQVCTALTTVDFAPDTADHLTTRNAVFSGCTALESVTLPARASLDDGNIFYGCTALESVSVAPGSETLIAENGLVFQREEDGSAMLCVYPFGRQDTSLVLPAEADGLPVTALAPMLFRGNNVLTEITVPESVTTIKRFAFQGCSSLMQLHLLSETPITVETNCMMGLPAGSVITVPNEEVATSIGPVTDLWDNVTNYYDPETTSVTVGSAAPAPAAVEAALSLKAAGLTEDGHAKFELYLDSASCVSTLLVKVSFDPALMTWDKVLPDEGVFENVSTEAAGPGVVNLMFNQLNNVLGYTGSEPVRIATITLQKAPEATGSLSLAITKASVSGINDVDAQAVSGTVALNAASDSIFVADYDVNGDAVIDQVDITEAQRYYRANTHSDNWTAASAADVNGDGQVDLEDLIAIFRNLSDF